MGRPGKKVRGHHKTIKYAKLRHFSYHGLFCIFQNWSIYEMAQTLRVFQILNLKCKIKLTSKVLHKIYIQINVHFMQDF